MRAEFSNAKKFYVFHAKLYFSFKLLLQIGRDLNKKFQKCVAIPAVTTNLPDT